MRVGGRGHITSTVPGMEPWKTICTMNIWWQTAEVSSWKGPWWLTGGWTKNWTVCDAGERPREQRSLARSREYLCCSKDLAPVPVRNGFPGTPAGHAKTAFSGFTTQAFCMEQENICCIFRANVISTAFCVKFLPKESIPCLNWENTQNAPCDRIHQSEADF